MAQITLRDYLQNTEDAISSGRIDDAMANCQRMLSYFPDAIEAQRLLGEVYMAQGHLEEAQQTFDWILTNDPENVIAYCNRALISERTSDIDTALDCYQQAYELSRGNSHIRQEFNQLSAKAGQQEFMFSRAGLARLYMRGDLLTQAIQEWEAVLNTSPDRLDARIGLLETYWRDGTNDKVEQLATQILEEIPTCLKALLLLAHVVSAYNLERAKELIQRAETLDPELIMAHDLFSDLKASQPNDPLLALLQKESIALPGASDDKQMSPKVGTAAVANGSHSPVESTDRVNDWNKLESWSELDATHAPQHDSQSVQEAPALSSWADTSNIKDVDSWATLDQVSENQIEPGLETWQAPQEVDDNFDPALLEQQPWFQADQLKTAEPESTSEKERKRSNLGSMESINSMNTWTTTQENDLPSPPAWLGMLTKKDRQPSGSMPILPTQSASVQEPLESRFFTQSPVEQGPASSKPEEEPALFYATEDKDPELAWPEWLKSLGAETLESEPEPRSAPAVPETQEPATFQPWEDQIDQTLSEADEQQLATLEHLESDLRSQGFVPLQPGTLSTLAQQPTLSSAFAELSNLQAQSATPEQSIVPTQPLIPEQPAASVAPSPPLSAPSGQTQPESWWADTLHRIATGSAAEQPISSGPAPTQVPEPVFVNPATDVPQGAPLFPGYRADALLENELETTMRRPAIRLQPVQHSAAHPDAPSTLNRGRGDKAEEGNLSNKERLLRGYQFQLAGAYDDAMQEYRIIIRNAPELLDEIISNVRALLKLAPKYSAGFRVLGDAYMRHGEYLQAMEAYNKALTIAKKAKSQSN
jgi:tetratricopeptide (TPR) repeat protein